MLNPLKLLAKFDVADFNVTSWVCVKFERDRSYICKVYVLSAKVGDGKGRKWNTNSLQRGLDQIRVSALVGKGNIGEGADANRS
jgi:hypothetical protein